AQNHGSRMPVPPADFEALYQGEFAYVVRTLRRLGVVPEDLEDAAHDVFVAAFRRREDRDPARPIRPWLFGIAYRVVGNYLQKAHRRRERPQHSFPDARSGGPTPEESAEQAEKRTMLLKALDSLDLEHRAVAVLYDVEGRPAPEIAGILGIPLNTVYSRARNARQKLLAATKTLRGET